MIWLGIVAVCVALWMLTVIGILLAFQHLSSRMDKLDRLALAEVRRRRRVQQ